MIPETEAEARRFLLSLFDAAVAAATPARVVPPHLPQAAEGPHHRARRRQGFGRDGQGRRGPLGRARSKAWSSPAPAMACPASGSRSSRRRIRCPTRAAATRRARILALAAERRAGRPRALPDLGRRLGAARSCRRRGSALEDKQAVNRALLALRRRHPRDEHGPQASLRDQGRPARRRGLSGRDGEPHHLRRAGRRPERHRLGADGRRPDHLRRRPRRARALRHRAAAGGRRGTSPAPRDETPKPGDPRLARSPRR